MIIERFSGKKLVAYKVVISILFGLVGFFVNLHGIQFSYPPYLVVMLLGLLFPLMIALVWGWKYGLISALSGGCQSMWLVWGPSNGYALFAIVPPFTLWILWHGYFADLRRKIGNYPRWMSKYVVEVPFRLISSLNLYTVTRWLVSLNPPPFSWGAYAPNTVPMEFTCFVVVKQAVIAYVILLLVEVLLSYETTRKFFGMKEKNHYQVNVRSPVCTFLLFAAFFWIADSIFGFCWFHESASFFDLFLLNIPPYVLFVRLAVILICIVAGLSTSRYLRSQIEAKKDLEEYSAHLEKLVKLRTRKLEDAQRQLVRKERLALLGQITGSVGHELRDPLGTISNAVYYLQTVLKGDGKVKEYLKVIASEVQRSENIVTELLSFSHSGTADRRNVSVPSVVSWALDKQGPVEGVNVVTEMDPDIEAFVDLDHLERILKNLVSNAYQSMVSSGTLCISVHERDKDVVLIVSDTGKGIPKEDTKVIFEPLYTTKPKGFGLGLTITKNLVEVNGGSISVSSKLGKGSTFTVTLPSGKKRRDK